MIEKLRAYVDSVHKIPEDLLDLFLGQWHPVVHKKKTVVTRFDKTDRYLHFTTRGIQKAYYLKEGKEFIIAFTYPFAFTCIPESFITQKPSRYNFECITDSEFLRISYSEFMSFVENHREFETLIRKTLVGTLNGVVTRYHRIIALSMEERFRDFMKNSPQLINQISHKDIANYLRMDPTNFSKLLNSIAI